MHLSLTTVVVEEYDPAIRFFVAKPGFELAEDSPALTSDGRPERRAAGSKRDLAGPA
jgi:catechol 2,3-dioxygenase-like lactoylglutathione lyase family enzyme